jgi:adenosine deaminase/adenosine deaminase CECR1
MLTRKIIEKWSSKIIMELSYPSDKLFFESFAKFSPTIFRDILEGLLELKIEPSQKMWSYRNTIIDHSSILAS